MDIVQVGFIGLVVITVIGAIKDRFPKMTGNTTRLVALVIGGVVGVVAQFGVLPGVEGNIVTGIMAGVAAVATTTIADRVGYNG